MSQGIVKVAGYDLGVGPGPLAARGVVYSGRMPGGHGTCTFDVLTDNAYLQPHNKLRVGNWVEVTDSDGVELFEGEILTVKPVIDVGGQHRFSVEVGGLLAVAARRSDLSKTWVSRGAAGWRIHPDANRSGEYVVGNDGVLQLLVRETSTTGYLALMHAYFVLDDYLSDDVISYISYRAEWYMEQSAWLLDATPVYNEETVQMGVNHTSSAGEDHTYTPLSQTNALHLYLEVVGTDTLARYVRFPTMDVYGSGKTAKVRVDQAMVDVATRPGLATSSLSEPIGQMLDDLRFKTMSAAGMLDTLAKMHAQPFDWGFWNGHTFRCRPLPRRPVSPARVIVVGGGNPGLVSWDVTQATDDVPDYVCVLHGNIDDALLPEGWVVRTYVPSEPPDTADVTVSVVDYSSLRLSNAAAAAIGANLLGANFAYELPSGAVFSIHPEFADSSYSAGNNTDPTSSYAQVASDAAAGTLTTFAYTTASGWKGTNSPVDPTCLVFDGASDYVDWGDRPEMSFAGGPFSVTAWFMLNALPSTTGMTIISDHAGNAEYCGWALGVSKTGNPLAYVGYTIGASSYYYVAASDLQLETGVWYHIALTWSGYSGTKALKVYLNSLDVTHVTQGYTGSDGLATTSSILKLGAI